MSEAEQIAIEQGSVDGFYQRLDELRVIVRTKLAEVRRAGPSGSPQNRSERDAFASMYEDRLSQLEAIEDRLCFGRLDFDDETVRYIGRIGLTDEDHLPLLTDWRAPAAEPFYQATAQQRGDVWRRRHLVTRGRHVTGLDDDLLDLDRAQDSHLTGEGALMAALARGRTAKMTDIVATIQREQDAIIRSELDGALVVQGGPGTGKTAVALHRAAYLLYAHRNRLERSGVLLVGPSRTFLRYIDQVLPSLGETGVVATTIGSLVPGITATGTDTFAAAKLKGRKAWVKIIAQAVRARERVPRRDIEFTLDGTDLTISRHDVIDAMSRARRSHKPHNEARAVFVRDMLRKLTDQYLAAQKLDPESADRAIVTEDLRTHQVVRRELNLCWFPISAENLVRDLFAKPHRLAEAAPNFSEQERERLIRDRDHPWTVDDIPILDEAWELLGPVDGNETDSNHDAQHAEALRYARDVLESTGAGGGLVDAETLARRFMASHSHHSAADRAAHDRSWVYGHVVVDEAQELSEMAWHSLLRRCPTRSFTIVGDIAQTSSPAGTRNWNSRLRPFFGRQLRQAALTVNYRTPRRIADIAMRVGQTHGLPVTTLQSARDIVDALIFEQPSRESAVAAALKHSLDELASRAEGRIALITTDPQRVTHAMSTAPGTPQNAISERLVVVTPQGVKGLEFDVVVVLEPAQILAGSGGAADLFVALTRPTQRLVVIHSGPLPQGFAG
ncbi:DNA helicase IV [Micrococcales bacterium KH10]|nr:DNA helicase IV [Micrococcales bacterium KH10]